MSSLCGALTFVLLDGVETDPEKTLDIDDKDGKKTTIPNPAYVTWVSPDQVVLGFLVNSFSPEITTHVVGL
jgi:hypothetical protein